MVKLIDMIKRKFGFTKIEVPVIGQGTWMLESKHNQKPSYNHRRSLIETIQIGLDLGLTHIDTAEMYGDGRVEEMVGEDVSERRNEVFLVSKVLPTNASYEGTLNACKRSLERLRTD